MTNAEFQEFYKKNKLAVVGVPFIIGFILFNQFVLKPRLLKKPVTDQATTQTAAVPGSDAAASPEAAPIGPPPPITVSMANVPPLEKDVEKRFTSAKEYKYVTQRNMFEPFYKQGTEGPVVTAPVEATGEVIIQHPDITYHGFFTIGQDRVAILKLSGRAILTRAGQKVIETPFVLEAIYPDRVEVVDTDDQTRRFEVALFEGQSTGDGANHPVPPGK